MDERRSSTGDVLALGITSIPTPKTDVPRDREEIQAEGDDFAYIGDAAVAEAIEAGKLVCASNYYGIPNVWKADEERA